MTRYKPLLLALVGGSLLWTFHADAEQLQYKVKAGDRWKLKTHLKGYGTMTWDAQGQKRPLPLEITIESTPVCKITSVDADGTFEVTTEYRVDVMKVLIGGKETPVVIPTSHPRITTKADKFGRVVEAQEPLNATSEDVLGVDFNLILSAIPNVFSEKDIRVGDTWEFRQQKNVTIKMTGKLLAIEGDVARVEYTMEIPLQHFAEALRRRLKRQTGQGDLTVRGKDLTGRMISLVNLSNGFPVRSEGVMHMDIEVEAPGQFRLHQVMQLTLQRELVP
ncbi:MAG: hypothetical protein NZT92_22895 [Abditibacteriales bacterium]|nr:hypothetical protein [Abditibacteriales bacterium]MDW8368476.1 hypothetical protein [Abditibacteriales bacterium]